MLDKRLPLTTIGHSEYVVFKGHANRMVPAKVDTGADISSVWATNIYEKDGDLTFKLFGPGSHFYTGETIRIPEGQFRRTHISNSFGTKELRYVVKLRVEVKNRTIKASFSLADRSLKNYPVLLGRRLLKGRFIVDVSQGISLEEQHKSKEVTV